MPAGASLPPGDARVGFYEQRIDEASPSIWRRSGSAVYLSWINSRARQSAALVYIAVAVIHRLAILIGPDCPLRGVLGGLGTGRWLGFWQ